MSSVDFAAVNSSRSGMRDSRSYGVEEEMLLETISGDELDQNTISSFGRSFGPWWCSTLRGYPQIHLFWQVALITANNQNSSYTFNYYYIIDHHKNHLSKDFVGIHLPGWLRNAHIALVLQLYIQLLVVRVFVRHHCLLVAPSHLVPIHKTPSTLPTRLIVCKSALVESTVRKLPLPLSYLVLSPLTAQLRTCLFVGVCATSVFFSEHPPTHIDIFVSISITAFTMFHSILPLPWLLSWVP